MHFLWQALLTLFLLYRELFSDRELFTDRELREARTCILTPLPGAQPNGELLSPPLLPPGLARPN